MSVRDEQPTIPAATELPAFRCPLCGTVSHNPHDLQYRYCGRCRLFCTATGLMTARRLPIMDLDREEAFDAAVELIGRTGGHGFEIGYRRDAPVNSAPRWYARAQFCGGRTTTNNHDPVAAAEAIAEHIARGIDCSSCGAAVALSCAGAASTPGICRWTRHGNRWVPGCESTTSTAEFSR